MSFQRVRAVSLQVDAATEITQRTFVTVGVGGLIETIDNPADLVVGTALESSAVRAAGVRDNDGTDVAVPVALLDGSIQEASSGAGITAGQAIIAGTDGLAYPSDSAAGGATPAGDYEIVGIATIGSGAAGEVVTFLSGRFGTVAVA